MEGAAINPVDLLVEIIKEHSPKDIWQGSPLLGYRMLGNTFLTLICKPFESRLTPPLQPLRMRAQKKRGCPKAHPSNGERSGMFLSA